MKAIVQKAAIVAYMASTLLCAREEKTNIADFVLDSAEVNVRRVCENDTPKTLLLTYQVCDPECNISYSEQLYMGAGGKANMDLPKALKEIQKKTGKKRGKYEVRLWLGIVTGKPIRPRMGLITRGLKLLERGIRITKKDFISKDHLQFYKSSKSKILYQSF